MPALDLPVEVILLLSGIILGELLPLVLILRGVELCQFFVGPDPGAALDVGAEGMSTVSTTEASAGAVAGGASEIRVFLTLPGARIDLSLPFGVLRPGPRVGADLHQITADFVSQLILKPGCGLIDAGDNGSVNGVHCTFRRFPVPPHSKHDACVHPRFRTRTISTNFYPFFCEITKKGVEFF